MLVACSQPLCKSIPPAESSHSICCRPSFSSTPALQPQPPTPALSLGSLSPPSSLCPPSSPAHVERTPASACVSSGTSSRGEHMTQIRPTREFQSLDMVMAQEWARDLRWSNMSKSYLTFGALGRVELLQLELLNELVADLEQQRGRADTARGETAGMGSQHRKAEPEIKTVS